MKTSLDHLPEDKQHQVHLAKSIILDAFKVDMLILFGSYARGDWQEELAEDGVHYQYQSDFDLLAVVKNEALATKIERKDSLHRTLFKRIRTPVTLIAQDIHYVNRCLSQGQFFFSDILKEGVVLHDSGKLTLAEPKELQPIERKKAAEGDFEYWFNGADGFLKGFYFYVEQDEFNLAAFHLHQVTERLFDAVLLVYTRYKPKTHDLQKLKELVTSIEPEFLKVFPEGTPEEKDRFELLRKAYVSARYNREYRITPEDLAWLEERVQYLRTLTESLCQGKIASFASSKLS